MTIRDVAREAGVSTATVSYVLNDVARVSEPTRERVLRTIQRLGYQPRVTARGLATRKTWAVGLVVPRTADFIFSDPYFLELLRGIMEVVTEADYTLVLSVAHQARSEASAYSRILKNERVDGILLANTPRTDDQVRLLAAEDLPFVVIGEPGHADGVSYVDVANYEGTLAATRYLLRLGHRRIVFLGGPPEYVFTQQRLQGYLQALSEAGLAPAAEDLLAVDFTQSDGYRRLRGRLASGPRPTAVVAASDVIALGAARALAEAGLDIPADVSLVGFDDIPLASYAQPALTTVRQPISETGRRAAHLLLRRLAGKAPGVEREILPVELVVRGSTAPPRGPR